MIRTKYVNNLVKKYPRAFFPPHFTKINATTCNLHPSRQLIKELPNFEARRNAFVDGNVAFFQIGFVRAWQTLGIWSLPSPLDVKCTQQRWELARSLYLAIQSFFHSNFICAFSFERRVWRKCEEGRAKIKKWENGCKSIQWFRTCRKKL